MLGILFTRCYGHYGCSYIRAFVDRSAGMLKFCGFDLELTVESVLQRQDDQPAVFTAVDYLGDQWLIVEADSDEHGFSWICAPVSDRVVQLLTLGRASATDAVRHSLTGWVEVIRVVDGHAVPDQRMSCSELAVVVGAPTHILCSH